MKIWLNASPSTAICMKFEKCEILICESDIFITEFYLCQEQRNLYRIHSRIYVIYRRLGTRWRKFFFHSSRFKEKEWAQGEDLLLPLQTFSRDFFVCLWKTFQSFFEFTFQEQQVQFINIWKQGGNLPGWL